MACDRTIHPLSLEALFGPEGIAADVNGHGYPDRLKVCIGVEPGLADAGVWAQVLNLAARMTGEVTEMDLPVVKALGQVSGDEATIVVHRPLESYPFAAEIRRSGRAVHLSGRSSAHMVDVLYSLAVNFDRQRGHHGLWSSMRIMEDETSVMEAFDRRGRAAGRYRLSPALPAAGKPGVGRFDLLDLEGSFYRVSAETPRAKDLALTIELPRQKLSTQVGFALAEAVVHAALEATRMELPLAVCGPTQEGWVVLRVEERPEPGARLAVRPGACRPPLSRRHNPGSHRGRSSSSPNHYR